MDTLIKSGRIKPSHALEIAESKIGLGFEKLDRDVFDLPIIGRPGPSPRIHQDESPWNLITGGFQKPNGSSAFVFWKPAPLLTTTFEGTASWQVAGVRGVPRLVDLLNGTVYDIPASRVRDEGHGCYTLLNLPVADHPLLIAFGDFL